MLLKLLVDQAKHRPELPPPYYRERPVRWAIQIDKDGRPRPSYLVPLAEGKKSPGRVMPTPYVYRSGQKPPPFLLVDTLQYVCAMPKDDSAKAEEEAIRRNDEYIALVRRWYESFPDDRSAKAVWAFFERDEHLKLSLGEAKPSDTVAFRISGDDLGYVHLADSVVSCWRQTVRERKSSLDNQGICLSCGAPGTLLDTIPEPIRAGAIPVAKGRGGDAQLISINKSAQGRRGIVQLANTPICDGCGQAVAVLNSLLMDDEHRHRFRDSVTVWWLKEPEDVPVNSAIKDADPVDIRRIHTAAQKYGEVSDVDEIDTNAYYAVTLSANQGRAVLRDWIDIPLPRVLLSVKAWFDDQEVHDAWKGMTRNLPLWQIARACGRWDRERKIYVNGSEPLTAEQELLKVALTGVQNGRRLPPPPWLLSHLLQRIRADARVDLPRVALLQLFLARLPKEATMSEIPTDAEAEDAARVWGRVFAVLETIQRRAIPDLNTSLRDRYFRVAMTRPRPTFVQLTGNAPAHLRKLKRSKDEKAKKAGWALETRLHTLINELPPGGPDPIFDLEQQARFVCGYHSQCAADITAARARTAASSVSDSDS